MKIKPENIQQSFTKKEFERVNEQPIFQDFWKFVTANYYYIDHINENYEEKILDHFAQKYSDKNEFFKFRTEIHLY